MIYCGCALPRKEVAERQQESGSPTQDQWIHVHSLFQVKIKSVQAICVPFKSFPHINKTFLMSSLNIISYQMKACPLSGADRTLGYEHLGFSHHEMDHTFLSLPVFPQLTTLVFLKRKDTNLNFARAQPLPCCLVQSKPWQKSCCLRLVWVLAANLLS